MAIASSVAGRAKGRPILVVCNKNQEVFFITTLLERFDYSVYVAPTAAQALDRIAVSVPDLVITDFSLPVLTGLDLLHMLKTDAQTSALPVVFLVPVLDQHTANRCIDNGAVGVINLPVQAEELYRTVQSVIEPVPRSNIRIEARLALMIDNMPLADGDGRCRVEISEQGMFVPVLKPYAKDDRVALRLQIADRTIDAECAVLYSGNAVAGLEKTPGIGLKFVNIMPQDQDVIRKFIRDEVTRGIKAE